MEINLDDKTKIRDAVVELVSDVLAKNEEERAKRSQELYNHPGAFIKAFFIDTQELIRMTISETIRQVEKLDEGSCQTKFQHYGSM